LRDFAVVRDLENPQTAPVYQHSNKASGPGLDPILRRLMEIARASALAEMASGVAHELNQPLGAIATFSQAGERMLDRPEPMIGRALDVFRQINLEALAAGAGIQRIRRLFERGVPNRARCQLPDLIAEVVPVLEILAPRGGGARVDVSDPIPDVIIDRLHIQHVLCALFQNAVEASSEALHATAIRIDISSDRYSVETGVTDAGPGVPAELQEQLFRPFFTTKAQGTGLGLASSRAIIESHDGTMGFANLPAGGSRFWFRLPVAELTA
jgi:C4-dicarboxylate-specific signal transduction histidine kinase